jgi:hypothetical protein
MPERVSPRDGGRAQPLLFGVAVVATYAVVGVGGGWMWHELWQPTTGVVFENAWYPDAEALRQEFSGTGLYALVAAGLGLALGAVFAFVGGMRPVLTVGLCVAGALLAGWLMREVGQWLGPADPHDVALDADDGDRVPSALRVSGLPPLFAFSLGSLLALGAIFTLFGGRTPELRTSTEPRR